MLEKAEDGKLEFNSISPASNPGSPPFISFVEPEETGIKSQQISKKVPSQIMTSLKNLSTVYLGAFAVSKVHPRPLARIRRLEQHLAE